MDDQPPRHLRLVHDKSAPREEAPALPKPSRPRRRRKAAKLEDARSCDLHAHADHADAGEIAALRQRIRELERESLRDNHVLCAATFVLSCAYVGFILWQRVAA